MPVLKRITLQNHSMHEIFVSMLTVSPSYVTIAISVCGSMKMDGKFGLLLLTVLLLAVPAAPSTIVKSLSKTTANAFVRNMQPKI